MARKSGFFRCPKCRNRIQKTAQAWVMGEVSRAIVMGDCKPTYCPFCGHEMDTLAIIDGKYDDKPAGLLGCLLMAAAIGGAYWYLHVELEFSQLAAGAIAVAAVVVGALVLAGVVRLIGGVFGKSASK